MPNLRLHDPIPAQVGARQSPPPPCMYYILLFAAKLRDCLMRIKVCIVLPYFNQKLFSRADVAHHKILILLKGHFTIYKVQYSLAIPDCLNDFRCRKNVCLAYSLSGDILKGQCNEIFECWFFNQKAPPGPLRGTLGRLYFLPKIHRDIKQKVGSAVYDTPRIGDSAVYFTPRNGDSAVYLTTAELVPKNIYALFCSF